MPATIAKSTPKPVKMGTVTGRDTTGTRVMVTLDPSTVPVPVKCPESVIVDVGDRVGLIKYEGGVLPRGGRHMDDGDWIITINYTLQTLCDVASKFSWGSTLTSTSATFVDMPSSPSIPFVKRRDLTYLRIYMAWSMYTNTTPPTTFHIGMNILSGDGSINYDEDVFTSSINVINSHAEWSSWITTGQLPATTYIGTARWYRVTSGTMVVDINDSIVMRVQEVVS